VTAKEILIDAKVKPPAAAKPLDDMLAKYSPKGGSSFGTS